MKNNKRTKGFGNYNTLPVKAKYFYNMQSQWWSGLEGGYSPKLGI